MFGFFRIKDSTKALWHVVECSAAIGGALYTLMVGIPELKDAKNEYCDLRKIERGIPETAEAGVEDAEFTEE